VDREAQAAAFSDLFQQFTALLAGLLHSTLPLQRQGPVPTGAGH
jgi:hypothetical protein